ADTGASSGSSRVRRGGSWCCSDVYCRVSYRGSYYPSNRLSYYGFRVVRSSSK
ncbi:SUMF1/EgtB/PvdO family nonheme iron enzyme, partial [Treponema sp.]|uniref:SUMF1/EgtB/PvdO family nonheme iron enzyme n=1 Tax=Treponema sp. TaxID=166 RepID=UPI0039C6A8BC